MRTRLLVTLTVVCGLAFAPSALAANLAANLAVGARGPAVYQLNERLEALSYLPPTTSNYYSTATYNAVMAFQKQAGISRDGVAGPQTQNALKSATRPRPRFLQAGRRAEVNLAKQVVYLLRGNQVVRTIHVASGASGYATPTGSYRVERQYLKDWSRPYKVWLPYASYFNGGIAFHASDSVPAYPASHGCVRVNWSFAVELYKFLEVGDSVRVY